MTSSFRTLLGSRKIVALMAGRRLDPPWVEPITYALEARDRNLPGHRVYCNLYGAPFLHRWYSEFWDWGNSDLAPVDSRLMMEMNSSHASNYVAKLCRQGQLAEAIYAVDNMHQRGANVNAKVLYCLLKCCSIKEDLAAGMRIQSLVVECGFRTSVFLANQLIRMFAACGSLAAANDVFCQLPAPDVFAWATIIGAHAKLGRGELAIRLYHRMQDSGVPPNDYVFVSALKACASIAAVSQGQLIHVHVVRSGFESNVFVGNTLIHMYAKCGSLYDARRVFDKLSSRNLVSWSTIVAAYAHHGHGQEAILLFEQMQEHGLLPDKVTFVNALKACTGMGALQNGKQIHSQIIERGFQSDSFIGSTLVNMYARCGSIEDARDAFDAISSKDQVSWNAMVAGYVQQERGRDALNLFWQMQREGTSPDTATLVSILGACANLAALEPGQLIHNRLEKSDIAANAAIGSILIDMYANCGSLLLARAVYDRLATKDRFSYTAMITACARLNGSQEAFQLFYQMQCESMQPDKITVVSMLKICTSLGAFDQGRLLDRYVTELGLEADSFVGSALIDMYTTCGSLQRARVVFDRLSPKDLVSWSSILKGYAQNGDGEDALHLFYQMEQYDLYPNKVIISCILQACSSIAALAQGKQIHAQVVKLGLESDVTVGNALINMYSKCGVLEDARKVFDKMQTPDIVSWNSMFAGYALDGQTDSAFKLFQQMQQESVQPDKITFLCLLATCSHAGSLDEGYTLFHSMSTDHGVSPDMSHYACIVDLLCRAGHLHAAMDFIKQIPDSADDIVWMSMLGACRAYGDVELGMLAFKSIIELDPQNTAAYILMSSLYAAAERDEESLDVRRMMHSLSSKKKPGRTWMEVENHVYTFMVEDAHHPERRRIYAELNRLHDRLSACPDLTTPSTCR